MKRERTLSKAVYHRVARSLFVIALAVLLLPIFAAQPSFALSDADYKAMLAESAEYRDADEGLNGAWKEAKKILPAAEFEKLRDDQRKWVKTGRDEEAKEQIAAGVSKVDAYTSATMERILYINTVISRSVLVHSNKGVQGLYTFTGKGMSGTLEVWWYDESEPELFVVFENSVLVGKDNAHLCSFSGRGDLEGKTLVAVDDNDETASVTIVFDGKKAVVSTDDDFKNSGFCGQGVYLDGVYSR